MFYLKNIKKKDQKLMRISLIKKKSIQKLF